MNNIDRALKDLELNDIYSIMLFAIFKLKNDPKYSTLSELCYVIDNSNFINLLKYYGGKTVTFPTLDEFYDMVSALCVYQLVNIEGIPYTRAIKDLEIDKSKLVTISPIYNHLCDILANYNFKRD